MSQNPPLLPPPLPWAVRGLNPLWLFAAFLTVVSGTALIVSTANPGSYPPTSCDREGNCLYLWTFTAVQVIAQLGPGMFTAGLVCFGMAFVARARYTRATAPDAKPLEQGPFESSEPSRHLSERVIAERIAPATHGFEPDPGALKLAGEQMGNYRPFMRPATTDGQHEQAEK
ncbi:hypothetical protein [Subtercola boreus]|uniref:Uncharacterized protein n=1 Tax=Subtercola boreus TaxID=120213 RepID=A0A3E0W755_9MICO|nr:hypothetical protein [Subtercola boreus]RFA17572.1 hypothetical protein B7R24_17050 [Subtercola boreus]RFA17708.1 hypothetical protein B7R23_16830 [Subtercola boreus]RFA24216.1 hypothetical protein B7R25_17235 [Subtercola boreus]